MVIEGQGELQSRRRKICMLLFVINVHGSHVKSVVDDERLKQDIANNKNAHTVV